MSDIAAGWKSDPTGSHDHRYWDGSAWTEHVSDAGVASTDPAPADLAPPAEPAAPDGPAEPRAGATPTSTFRMTEEGTDTPAEVEEPTSTFRMTEEGTDTPAEAVEPTSTFRMTEDGTEAPTAEAEEPTSTFRMTEEGTEAPAAGPSPASPSWAMPTVVNEPTDPAGTTGAGEPSADDPATSAGDLDDARPGDEPAAPSYSSPLAPTAATAATAATDEADEVTEAIPTADPGAFESTTEWPTAPITDDAPPPPTFTPPPEPAGGGGSKGRLLIGIGVVAVVAVVLALLFLGGGDGDDDLQDRISNELRDGGQSGLDEREADCLAGKVIDHVGADKLKDVDFSASNPPEAIADELNDAFVAAIPACDIKLGDNGAEGPGKDDDPSGSSDSDDSGAAPGTDLTPEQVAQFRDLLAKQYRETLGLSDEKADCLAGTMADAIKRGELDQNQSFDAFFQYLTTCDISVSELNGPDAG
jgi:hypothetical protein